MRRAEMREDIIARVCRREESNKPENVKTSLPYFGVKLSCLCLPYVQCLLMEKIAYSYYKVTYSYPKVTYSDLQ